MILLTITVGLENYLVHGAHGYFEEEHLKTQPFNITVRARLSSTIKDGEIDTTLDYAKLQAAVDEIVINTAPIQLLESMAQQISQIVQQSSNVKAIFVRIEKPEAPLPHPGGLPFVEYTWNR